MNNTDKLIDELLDNLIKQVIVAGEIYVCPILMGDFKFGLENVSEMKNVFLELRLDVQAE